MAEYIEREALLKAVSAWRVLVKDLYDCGYDDCITAMEDTISDAPAADVEPVRRGVWELDYDRNFHRCSNCKESSIRYTDEWGYEIDEELTNFCPECGAKLDV